LPPSISSIKWVNQNANREGKMGLVSWLIAKTIIEGMEEPVGRKQHGKIEQKFPDDGAAVTVGTCNASDLDEQVKARGELIYVTVKQADGSAATIYLRSDVAGGQITELTDLLKPAVTKIAASRY